MILVMRTTLDLDEDVLQAAKEIAAARGMTAGKVLSELARRARGDAAADTGLSQEIVQSITQLAVACVQAGLSGTGLPSEAAGPLQPLGHYLRRLATGPAPDTLAALATPPAGLPEPLPQLFAQLRDAAVCDAGAG